MCLLEHVKLQNSAEIPLYRLAEKMRFHGKKSVSEVFADWRLACKGITKRGSIPERYLAKGATDE
ncbi:hypothetical protein C7A11_15810 [Pseudomonas simiae]|nr:hypothetical protein PFLUOLIPICF7_16385 [Pseudomonas simiae]PRW87435.1 hypothetical protein C7A11_15810 [Pseudomonas simiae]